MTGIDKRSIMFKLTSFLIIIVFVFAGLLTASLGVAVKTEKDYRALLDRDLDKYDRVSKLETLSLDMKYRKQLNYDIGYQQLKLLIEMRKYIEKYGAADFENGFNIQEITNTEQKDINIIMSLMSSFGEKDMDIDVIIASMRDVANYVSDEISMENDALKQRAAATRTIMTVIFFAALIVIIYFCCMFPRRMAKPIIQLAKWADDIKEGNLNTNVSINSSMTEISVLKKAFESMSDTFRNVVNSVNNVCSEYEKGKISSIDTNDYKYAYKELTEGINNIVMVSNLNLNILVGCLEAYAEGNFEFEYTKFKGDFESINRQIEVCNTNLQSIVKDIRILGDSIQKGSLDMVISSEGRSGDWKILVEELNALSNVIKEPIENILSGLEQIAKANLDFSMNENYTGVFNDMQDKINYTAHTLKGYVSSISFVLNALANKDLTVKSDVVYEGDFDAIGNSIDILTSQLNVLLSDLSTASSQIETGSRIVADSSTSLAMGASQQTDSVNKLVEIANEVLDKSNNNFEQVVKMDDESTKLVGELEIGKEVLNNLNTAISNVAESSAEVSKINKVIDDIAFQTNILAINAAIEAARAGRAGKGFAVVADEVRSLAGKTQESAETVSRLLDEVTGRVDVSTKAVDETTMLLNTVMAGISAFAEELEDIKKASREQSELATHMESEVANISNVVKETSMTSENAAATSEELASQIDTFNENLRQFKL